MNKKEKYLQEILQVIIKAWKDPELKKKLLQNPDKALKNEGLHLPPGFQVEFHENTSNHVHFTIPNRPEGNLSNEQLLKVAGGKWVGNCAGGD